MEYKSFPAQWFELDNFVIQYVVKYAYFPMGEYSSKKSLSCQNSDFVNPYLTNFVLEHYLHFLGYFENFELKDLGI